MRLLNPIVLQLRQDQVVLAYPFKYLSAVNGKVSEIVVNYENKHNYSGCDDTSSINPTCGVKYNKGIKVSYSEGFCCACPAKPAQVKHPRGGQDCSLKVDPQDVEKQRYKASAHCLQFSDIWFSVSALDDPIINHNVYLQVFNERQLINGSSVWVSLTNGEVFQLSTKEPSVFGANRTIVATFMTTSAKNGTPLISAENNRLLIPQPIPGVGLDKLPPVMKNGAKDYILLSKSVIDASGIACDKAGISYEGFYKQKKRCKVAKNTCLKNQPLDFWEGDEEKRKAGKKGSYLLQFYGQPHKNPILIEKDTKEHFLVLEYYEKQLSVLTVEFKADDITTLFIGKDVHIMKVITASSGKQILFNVTVANDGLVEATYSAKAKNCQYEVPESKSVTQSIAPQGVEELLLLSVPGAMELNEKFFCTVIVSSKMYGVVAKRKVTVKPRHRCVCIGHCECACYGESVVCHPMAIEAYQEAGYKGDLPVLTARPPKLPWIVEHPFFALFALFLILLILGSLFKQQIPV